MEARARRGRRPTWVPSWKSWGQCSFPAPCCWYLRSFPFDAYNNVGKIVGSNPRLGGADWIIRDLAFNNRTWQTLRFLHWSLKLGWLVYRWQDKRATCICCRQREFRVLVSQHVRHVPIRRFQRFLYSADGLQDLHDVIVPCLHLLHCFLQLCPHSFYFNHPPLITCGITCSFPLLHWSGILGGALHMVQRQTTIKIGSYISMSVCT